MNMDFDNTTTKVKDLTFLNGILNHVIDPVLVKDKDYRFVFLNDAGYTFTGLEDRNPIGKDDYAFFPKKEADIFRSVDKLVFETGKTNVNIENFTDAKGVKYIISTKKSLYTTAQGAQFLVMVIRDISEIKKTEQHLLKSVDRLADFAYAASHDIKSPLRTINSFSNLLYKKYHSELPEEALTFLSFIQTASTNATKLVEDLLTFSTTSKAKLQIDAIDLNQIIQQIKEDLNIAIQESKAVIHYEKLPIINGSKVRLYQLFQNLIANSIKFKKATAAPIIHITHQKLPLGDEITVRDNGIGIEKKYLHKVFDIFTKLNADNQNSGSGIGLATCKKIIHQMNGDIQINSEFGKGTTFTIFFPIETDHKSTPSI